LGVTGWGGNYGLKELGLGQPDVKPVEKKSSHSDK